MCSQARRDAEIEMMRSTNLKQLVSKDVMNWPCVDERDNCDQEWVGKSSNFEEVL